MLRFRAAPCALAMSCALMLFPFIPAFVPAAEAQRVDGEDVITLPMSRAVLYGSGVGYFEHEGVVEGSVTVRLHLRPDQVNDVLKSMVVMDDDGGRVTHVNYPSNDPAQRALRSFALDLSGSPTIAQLVAQLRGIELILHTPEAVRGTVINVEYREKMDNGVRMIDFYVTLAASDGIVTLPLAGVQRIELADEAMQSELRSALEVLRSSRDAQRRPVDIRFEGDGQRRVRIGYLVETPIWKTSYRLDLSEENNTPRLQGWSIVENAMEVDWRGIGLSLMSGRPVSFVQDLYTPLFLARPVVEPPHYVGLESRLYEGGFRPRGVAAGEARGGGGGGGGFGGGGVGAGDGNIYDDGGGQPQRGRQYGGFMGQLQRGGGPVDEVTRYRAITRASDIDALAAGTRIGELFEFTLQTPVTIARRQSAMLPIINHSITIDRISIYNDASFADHPMHGAIVVNETDLTLMPGPVTVFDRGAYAGDAQLGAMQPNERRLISYAVDQEVRVELERTRDRFTIAARIVEGQLQLCEVSQIEATY